MLLLSAGFQTDIFFKILSWSHSRVLNILDPDQDRHSVGPDLDQNCFLQRLSADDKSPH